MEDEIEIVKQFIDIGVLKFGSYVLKSGVTSPVYVDLRRIISFPSLMKKIAEKAWEKKIKCNIEASLVCGIPYTALPVAATLSILHNVPMVLTRKEAKGYGTNKILEGVFEIGQKCLILEDVVTTGSSVLETVSVLKKEGLIVTDCIVILDRQQGAAINLSKCGISLHSIFQMQEVISIIQDHQFLPNSVIENVRQYFSRATVIENIVPSCSNLTFLHRAEKCSNVILKKLFHIMDEKKSNLCVSVDVESRDELFNIVDLIGPHICLLKTHIDILKDFSDNVPDILREKAEKYNFLILEDRKFADIGYVVIQQYKGGKYKIQDWADIVTVHSIPGENIVKALKLASINKKAACVLVAQMSSEGALTDAEYTTRTVDMAESNKDFVIGFISQSKVAKKSDFIHICPGVNIDSSEDKLGQQYRTPEKVIKECGIDIIVVGRGILKAENIVETTLVYKNRAFSAYMETVKK